MALQKLSLEYETELPAVPVPGQDYNLATRILFYISGTVDPAAAVNAFDPQRKLSPTDLARNIKENMRGWMRHSAVTALTELLSQPGADPLQAILEPDAPIPVIRRELAKVFGAWTFQIEELSAEYSISTSCVMALPEVIRQRLSFLEGEADTAAAFGPFAHEITQEIAPTTDPLTDVKLRVTVWSKAVFTAHPERCHAALDPQDRLSSEELAVELTKAVGPWIDYAVKQAFFNTVFDEDEREDSPGTLADDSIMKQRASDLCRQKLAALGLLHLDIQLAYSALDEATAKALLIPLAGSTQSPLKETKEAPSGDIPPIEEAVFRHQQKLIKENPGLNRKEMARRILSSLENDGYPVDARRVVGRQLGADPADLP